MAKRGSFIEETEVGEPKFGAPLKVSIYVAADLSYAMLKIDAGSCASHAHLAPEDLGKIERLLKEARSYLKVEGLLRRGRKRRKAAAG